MTQEIIVEVKKLPHGTHLPLPSYQTSGSAGMDLYLAVETPITLQPLERALLPTGITLALPNGFEAQIRPRSGLALKHGLTVLNTPGTIDADYRGEIRVIMVNLSKEAYTFEPSMRFAQLVITQVEQAVLTEVNILREPGENIRSLEGFGSTGI